MGDQIINCPLCCNKAFDSKQSLLQHLSDVLENLYCPVCNQKYSSIVDLSKHLNEDDCQPDNTVQTIVFEETTEEENLENPTVIQSTELKAYENEIHTSNADTHFNNDHIYEAQVTNDSNKMYVELFSTKSMSKQCLQTRELQLVKENGENRYMIVGDDLSPGTIVTKQNNDGTISLTTVKDMKMEGGTLIMENEMEAQYSCNTCNLTFSSVMEHIQTYHSNEQVLLEDKHMQMEAGEVESMPIVYEHIEPEDPLTLDQQTPRRVITDTGDIVEEPLMYKSDAMVDGQETIAIETIEQPVKDQPKKVRLVTKRVVQVADKKISGNSVIKTTNTSANSKGRTLYHKVIIKDVQTEDGTPVKMYQCQNCDLCVTDPNEFKIKECRSIKYTCPHCPVTYENAKSLCAHMKAHKVKPGPDDMVTYECNICCTVFPTNKSLKLHKRMHDPIKTRPIEPPVENNDGSEVNEGKYLCHVCDKLIPEDYRTIHQNSHKTSNKMNCGICNKKFSSAEYLEMHMNVHNLFKVQVNNQDESLPYNCVYCNRRFARPHEKVKHERIHTGEKPHSCEICGKSFRVSYCLTLHMRTHTGARPYACPHCGKRFKAHSVYNHHLLTHSEVRAYKCPYCPKAFKTSVQLAGHKNSHTKPFSCQHCNRPFASLYAVRVHTETHARQNNLKFSCNLCGASYARAFALKDHIKTAHKKEQGDSPSELTTEDDWITKDEVETSQISGLSKDMTPEITVLGMGSELIVP